MEDSCNMNEVVPNLWLGDLASARDTETLKQRNIHSVLSAMRGKVVVEETFNRLQISIDDTDEEDILKHLVVAITFIQSELDKGRGVLVHCMAGISRSTSLVAAYLMYSRDLSPQEALMLIRQARPIVEPNDSFLAQLKIFHKASCKVSMHDKATRMYYLERMVKGILNGEDVDRAVLATTSPSSREAAPSSEKQRRRRIRCKMCRQELATRENMQDHGQLSSPSPAVSYSPIVPSSPSFADTSDSALPKDVLSEVDSSVKSSTIDEAEELGRRLSETVTLAESDGKSNAADEVRTGDELEELTGDRIIRPNPPLSVSAVPNARPPLSHAAKPVPKLAHPSDISAQLYDNPALAALRPGLSVVPAPSPSLLSLPSGSRTPTVQPPAGSPLLINPKCSGYFVEPVGPIEVVVLPYVELQLTQLKWMDSFLENGQLSGKIVCPNKKCNAKLGNYDWAGVCCSCKEWVVPGFCIHRSKVDEVV